MKVSERTYCWIPREEKRDIEVVAIVSADCKRSILAFIDFTSEVNFEALDLADSKPEIAASNFWRAADETTAEEIFERSEETF